MVGEGPEPASTTFPHTLPVSSPEASASGQGLMKERKDNTNKRKDILGLEESILLM